MKGTTIGSWETCPGGRRSIGMGLAALVGWLGWIGAATADITALAPAEGSVGTAITVTGSGFGDKRGKAQLGNESLKVAAWSDTQIQAVVATPQPPGEYVVRVQPQGGAKRSSAMTFGYFTIRAPEVDLGLPLQLVSPGDRATVTGSFFGSDKGEVYLVDQRGQHARAKIRDWSMETIRIEIPSGLVGTCWLGVSNAVGSEIVPLWGTFTAAPPGAGLLGSYQWEDVGTIQNAAATYYNDAMWIFSPAPSKDYPYIKIFQVQNGEMTDRVTTPGGSTLTTMAPLVINHILWLFVTGEDGDLCYNRYDVVSNRWESSWYHIPGASTPNSAEIAPVHNLATGRVEIYYQYTNSISWVYSDDYGLNWHAGGHVAGIGTVTTAPSAVFYQKSTNDYSTLVSVGIASTTTVYTVRNGVASAPVSVPFGKVRGRPFLFHLGEEYIGVVWREEDMGKPWLCKLDKRTGQWLTKYQPLNVQTDWAPGAVIDYEQKAVTNAPPNTLGYRWDAHFYLIYGKQVWYQANPIWQVTPVEYVGYWAEPTSPKEYDLGAEQVYQDTFTLWPVIGVIDAPPYVLNRPDFPEECDEWACNSLTFGRLTETGTSIGVDLKAGPYIETGEKSPLKLELTAAVNAKFEHEESSSVESKDTLYSSPEGAVMVYYVAPKFLTHVLEWFNMSGAASSNFIYQLEVTGATVMQKQFDPAEMPFSSLVGMPPTYFDPDTFPYHGHLGELDRLHTYEQQSGETWFYSTVSWNSGGDNDLQWTQTEGDSRSIGCDIEFKLGGHLNEFLGMGAAGAFSMHVTSTAKVSVSSRLHMVPAKAEEPGEISFYRVQGYWLKPDETGYWVPVNRQGQGDRPWFITYGVDMIDTIK